MATSFLTLGGWDESDYTGEIAWFRTGGHWNQTMTKFSVDGTDIIQSYDLAPVIFETGYPYIGLSPAYYDRVADVLERKYRKMNCTRGEHWGICRVEEQTCGSLGLNQMLSFTIENYEFKVPLDNIAVYANQSGTYYCQMQIALLSRTHNAIVLGGAFFTAFTGMFFSENERLGFASSTRALPGNSLTCIGDDCAEFNESQGIVTPEETKSGSGSKFGVILLILGLSLLTVLCVLAALWYRKKSQASREFDEDLIASRKGKRGYSIQDEKEIDSDEDDTSQGYAA